SSRRRHTRFSRDWSSDVCSSDLLLGICDKIVPGLFIGAAAFGHLPVLFVPGGPMPSGIPNTEKSRIRNLFAEGKATREELLAARSEERRVGKEGESRWGRQPVQT